MAETHFSLAGVTLMGDGCVSRERNEKHLLVHLSEFAIIKKESLDILQYSHKPLTRDCCRNISQMTSWNSEKAGYCVNCNAISNII